MYDPPHVKCLHFLYDSYGPPYLIWNRYLMVPLPDMEQVSYGLPTCMYGPPHVQSDGSPLPHMEQVSYGPPTCTI